MIKETIPMFDHTFIKRDYVQEDNSFSPLVIESPKIEETTEEDLSVSVLDLETSGFFEDSEIADLLK